MKTLTSSYFKIFVDKDKGFSCSRDFVLNRPEICFLRSPKVVNARFFHLVAVQRKAIHLVTSVSSESQAELETVENQIQEEYQSKTVHVKFELEKECSFGEKFLIVGEDPMFGLWDPSHAVPLNWSDGHVWAVELDIPVGKSIHFKFILKGNTGNILWQPGPDRIFQAWESKNRITVCEDWENAELQKIIEEENRITVCEDWENAELQKIIEEEPFINRNEDPTVNSAMLIIAENLTQPEEDPASNVNEGSAIADGNTYSAEKPLPETYKEQIVADNIVPSQPKPLAMVAENISYPKEDPEVNASNEVLGEKRFTYPKQESMAVSRKDIMITEKILGNNGRAATAKNSASKNVEGNLITYEGGPVLVPGLTPLSTISTGEAILNGGERTAIDDSVGVTEAKDYNLPELDEKQEPDGDPHQGETTQMVNVEEEQLDNKLNQKPHLAKEEEQPNLEPVDNKLFKNDIQWGRKTLHKLLTNFGLL